MTAYTEPDTIKLLAQGLPRTEGAAFCYVAQSRGITEGMAFFALERESVVLLAAQLESEGDAALLDGLLRAGLAFAQSRGIRSYLFAPECERIAGCSLERMNFTIGRECDIQKFFDTVKQCGC